jgi:hypothetical protein
MDEIGLIYELSTIDSNWWVDEKTFEDIKGIMKDGVELAFTFSPIYGGESTILIRNITSIGKTTRAEREAMREMNKEYRAAEVEEKKEWQE